VVARHQGEILHTTPVLATPVPGGFATLAGPPTVEPGSPAPSPNLSRPGKTMADTPTNFRSFDQQDHLQVIDALRGYAILIVIAVHTLGYVPDLAWPVKRVLTMGFYGVQLFFLASAVTLMMSWHRSADPFGPRSLKFLVRRFFRIAPLYWMAVVFYWFAYQIQAEQFSLQLLLATLFFYNAWSPYLIPTVPGWTPVPGGWSIGVEFCFYFTFPLIATLVTSLRRALVFVALSLGVMLAASHFGQGLYPEIGPEERANFLYFWPPTSWWCSRWVSCSIT
jgi:peptidoglycan/LPS O-acetylase OafA/YrhL